jgi:hypothetical protein
MSKKLKDEAPMDDNQNAESASSEPVVGAVVVDANQRVGVVVKTVMEWALEKGHIASAKPVQYRGQIHMGRDVEVIRFHGKLTANQPMTEAEYDAAGDAAYGLAIR